MRNIEVQYFLLQKCPSRKKNLPGELPSQYAALDPLLDSTEKNENSIKGQPLKVLWPSDPV